MSKQWSGGNLVVVSTLDGKGPTGVETHFNQIMAHASVSGVEATLISSEHKFPSQRLLNGLGKLLRKVHFQASLVWQHFLRGFFLRRQVRGISKGYVGQKLTFYAQDSLSACAALAARRDPGHRVVLIVHYNISEADELVAKGLVTESDTLYRRMMDTERQALMHADYVIFVSLFMQRMVAQRVQDFGPRPQAIIPNFSSLPVTYGEATGGRDLIAIGTLEVRKNQVFLLDILARCKAKGYRYTLTLVGEGPDRKRLESMAAALDIAEQVSFLGFRAQASRLIPGHKLLVHAAQIENLPITLIESLSYGVPVIAAAVGGIPEVIESGVQGVHWPLDDPEKAADLLIQLMEDAERLERMSNQAKIRFDSHFHPDVLSRQWLSVLLGN